MTSSARSQRDRVRIVRRLQRDVLGAVLDVRAEAADVATVTGSPSAVSPSVARQLEELERLGQRDGVHLLAGAQARELGLLFVVLGADLHERTVAAHAHA